MKVLLDTQTWLWMQVSPERMNSSALTLVSQPEQELLLSAASSWEIAIKYALGKLPLPMPPLEYVPDRMRSSGVGGLTVSHTHVLAAGALPPYHRDPFDRLLVAQAQIESLTILTADRVLGSYDVPVQWSN